MTSNNRVTFRVWGDYAFFMHPEMKVERVSYPIMTPSAARSSEGDFLGATDVLPHRSDSLHKKGPL